VTTTESSTIMNLWCINPVFQRFRPTRLWITGMPVFLSAWKYATAVVSTARSSPTMRIWTPRLWAATRVSTTSQRLML